MKYTKAERLDRIKIKKYFAKVSTDILNRGTSAFMADTVLKYHKLEQMGLNKEYFGDPIFTPRFGFTLSNYNPRFKRFKVNYLEYIYYLKLKPYYEKYLAYKELTHNLPINDHKKKTVKI